MANRLISDNTPEQPWRRRDVYEFGRMTLPEGFFEPDIAPPTGIGTPATRAVSRKQAGAYYTPDPVAASLVEWAVRTEADRMLDPACGDGRFIRAHRNSVGIERDPHATATAIAVAPWARVHESDFFVWAAQSRDRFDCAAGNPPFIRYQTFNGTVRERAVNLCARLGAKFSGLASSWPLFLVAAAGLLKRGDRMAFVVPAEIGHAPYAAPLLEYLVEHFAVVHIVAVREKLFPDLSEDCWLLYAEGYGTSTSAIRFTALDTFTPMQRPPRTCERISVREWRTSWKRRLRPYLLSRQTRDLYQQVADAPESCRLGDLASVGIGYVSGANDFFHLRPSQAERFGIPRQLLHPTVRNGRALRERELTRNIVQKWVMALWGTPFVQLSCELEGHPLGGGMLKLEPREAAEIVLPSPLLLEHLPGSALADAIMTMQTWRHYAAAT